MYRRLKLALCGILPLFIFGFPQYLSSEVLNVSYVDPITKMEFVKIEAGTFVMGDILSQDKDASPPHTVAVNEFEMGKFEVTFEQYDMFCETTGKDKPGDNSWGRSNRPAINVSWQDARDFATWLSKQTNRKIRLPSESEWEYAARAGKSTSYWWGNSPVINVANCADCGSQWDNKSTAPVGAFNPNLWGLFDMAGNVHEWTLDSVHENYQGAPSTSKPWPKGDEKQRIVRGGSYNSGFRAIASGFRDWFVATERSRNTGFRLVIED